MNLKGLYHRYKTPGKRGCTTDCNKQVGSRWADIKERLHRTTKHAYYEGPHSPYKTGNSIYIIRHSISLYTCLIFSCQIHFQIGKAKRNKYRCKLLFEEVG